MGAVMKVLRLTPHFYAPAAVAKHWDVHMDPIGGMQTQIHRLAMSLAERGVHQTILTMRIGRSPRRWSAAANTEVIATNLPVVPLRSRVRGTVGLNVYWGIGTSLRIVGYRLRSLFRGAEMPFDLIHCHCSGVPTPLLVGVVAKKILQRPLVFTVHCCRLSTYEPMNALDRLINGWALGVEAWCLSRADRIIVLTARTAKRLREEVPALARTPILVVPDFISFAEARGAAAPELQAAFRRRFSLPEDQRLIVYAGRIAHEKGWPHFVDVAERLARPDVHFLVCGDGNERRSMERLIARRGLRDRFTITGFIENRAVLTALSTADVVVIPSVHEEFGSLLLEAASVEAPVVAAAVGGLAENVVDGTTGMLVPPEDAAAFARRVAMLLDEPARGRELGRRLRAELEPRFDESRIVPLVLGCYQRETSAVSSPARPRSRSTGEHPITNDVETEGSGTPIEEGAGGPRAPIRLIRPLVQDP